MKKRVFALATAGIMAVSLLAACGSGSSNAPASNAETTAATAVYESGAVGDQSAGQVDTNRQVSTNDNRYDKVVIALNADPEDLNPVNMNTEPKQLVFQTIYETLFDLEASNEGMDMYVPVLASGWEMVDETTYDVTLYDYITDWNGNNIDANDVKFCYDKAQTEGFVNQFTTFDSLEVIDDYTLRFNFTKPIDSLGELEWIWCRICIVDESVYADCARNPVGTGVYKVAEYTTGSKLVLEANDDYWQTDETKIAARRARNVQTIEYDIILESAQQVIALQNGTIMFSNNVPNDSMADFEDGGQYADQYDVNPRAQSNTIALIPNEYEESPCADINLRLAIFYALDNGAIATASGGLVGQAFSLGSPFMPDYNAEWVEHDTYINTTDIDKAKEYLEASSYNGESLRIAYSNSETFKLLATVVQAQLSQIGITCELTPNDNAQETESMYALNDWDLKIIQCGGNFQVGAWNKIVNFNSTDMDHQVGNYVDQEQVDLYLTARSLEGHTYANMWAVVEHIVENARMTAIGYGMYSDVYSSDIASLFYREKAFLMPGACVYYLD